ncbi:tetratricopeptide repeat protein [Sphingomonas sp.]|uniref:tetratricopeptide repeat protein n=1 Tax=Sphingomonas sp. TaxID=28214 RepID=UPI00307F6F0A
MLYPLLLAIAGLPDQDADAGSVAIVQPSAEFDAALEAGATEQALNLIAAETRACIGAAGGPDAAPSAQQPCVLLVATLASTASEAGRSAEAVPIARRAVAIAESFSGADRADYVTAAHLTLGLVLERQGQHLAAEPSFVIALDGAETLLAGQPELAAYVARRANNLISLARFAEALPLAERAVTLAGDTVDGAFFRLMHGKALMGLGRLAEAEATLRSGADRLHALAGATYPQTVALRETLAWCLDEQNRPQDAMAILRETLAIRRQQAAGPLIADSLTLLGMAAMRVGDLREAETVLREALTIRLRYFGETSNFTALAYSNLGQALVEAGRYEDGAWMFNRAIAVWQASGGGNPDELVAMLTNMASVLARVRAFAEAEPVHRQALAIAEESLGAGHIRTVLTRNNLAAALSRSGKRAEAVALFTTNYAAAGALGGQGVQMRTIAAASLAHLLDQPGDAVAARSWHARALDGARIAFRDDHPHRINIGWNYGRALLREPATIPQARTLLREAGRQVLVRAGRATSFDASALDELNGFTVVFSDQVRAAWSLAQPRR